MRRGDEGKSASTPLLLHRPCQRPPLLSPNPEPLWPHLCLLCKARKGRTVFAPAPCPETCLVLAGPKVQCTGPQGGGHSLTRGRGHVRAPPVFCSTFTSLSVLSSPDPHCRGGSLSRESCLCCVHVCVKLLRTGNPHFSNLVQA